MWGYVAKITSNLSHEEVMILVIGKECTMKRVAGRSCSNKTWNIKEMKRVRYNVPSKADLSPGI